MLNIKKLPLALKNNPSQLANYCAVEIAELLTSCPHGNDIIEIEKILMQFKAAIQ